MQNWLERNRNQETIKQLQKDRLTVLTEVASGNIDKIDGKAQLAKIAEEIYSLYVDGREVSYDSPIEEMMHKAMTSAMNDFLWVAESVSILPQFEVFDSQYRLDFAIFVRGKGKSLKIAIECDGHLYHETDKDQVARDKQRERRLVIDGWAVLRFSGREIHDNVDRCVSDILRYVEAELLQRRSAV